jgi:hypothetical protein
MSQDLVNSQGSHFRCTSSFFASALTLAEEYGWVESGTVEPLQGRADGTWAGGYDTNNGQIVLDEDARQLGAALVRALSNVPDAPAEGWLLSGVFREHLSKLATFCLSRGFRIY